MRDVIQGKLKTSVWLSALLEVLLEVAVLEVSHSYEYFIEGAPMGVKGGWNEMYGFTVHPVVYFGIFFFFSYLYLAGSLDLHVYGSCKATASLR